VSSMGNTAYRCGSLHVCKLCFLGHRIRPEPLTISPGLATISEDVLKPDLSRDLLLGCWALIDRQSVARLVARGSGVDEGCGAVRALRRVRAGHFDTGHEPEPDPVRRHPCQRGGRRGRRGERSSMATADEDSETEPTPTKNEGGERTQASAERKFLSGNCQTELRGEKSRADFGRVGGRVTRGWGIVQDTRGL